MSLQQQVLQSIDQTHREMMDLLNDLEEEQLDVPFERGINPPIWEVGHSAFFYEFFLLRPLYKVDPIMPGFDTVWDSFDIPHRERWTPGVVPGKRETLAYYDRVVGETRDRLASGNSLTDEEAYLGQYVVAHQQMHLESLIWCRQTLGYPKPSYTRKSDPLADESACGDAKIPAGTYFIGVPTPPRESRAPNFSFDNERPGFEKEIEEFHISKTLVSQGEFLEFVEDDGYTRPDLWSFGGNYWRRQYERKCPRYWEFLDGEWTVRRFDEQESLGSNCPMLHLSFWEAEAYCQWAGRRLPSEFEWEIAARGAESRRFPWGESPCSTDQAAMECVNPGTAPVTAYADSASPFGCLQMIGTAWEWTSSQYLPFDGFCVDMYPYMSTLQFGDHKTTRGGSLATSASLIRNTYRQAIFPDRNDMFTGFRTCAKS